MPFLEEETAWARPHGRKVKRSMPHSKTRKKVSVAGMRKQRVKQHDRVRPLRREVLALIWEWSEDRAAFKGLQRLFFGKWLSFQKKRFWEIGLEWKYYIRVHSVIWEEVRWGCHQKWPDQGTGKPGVEWVIILDVKIAQGYYKPGGGDENYNSVPEVWWMGKDQ